MMFNFGAQLDGNEGFRIPQAAWHADPRPMPPFGNFFANPHQPFWAFESFMSGDFGFANASEQTPPQQPAASKEVLQTLPEIRVTKHDIQQDQESTCPICLERFEIGDAAIRLPCGHVFHPDCIRGWLVNSNRCAVCRHELATENLEYERERKAVDQRLRLGISDLSRRSIRELRFLSKHLGVDTTGCLEKQDLIDCIVASGLLDIAPEMRNSPSAEEIDSSKSSLLEKGISDEACTNELQSKRSSVCQDLGEITKAVPKLLTHLHKFLGKGGIVPFVHVSPALRDTSPDVALAEHLD